MKKQILKHALSGFLLCGMLCGLCSCGGGTEVRSTDTDPSVSETTEAETKEELPVAEWNSWITNGFDKILQETEAPGETPTEYDLYMAKNETESCQIAIRADKRIPGCTLVCTDAPEDAPAVTVMKEFMIPIKEEHYPDPIAPLTGKLTVLPHRTSTFLTDFRSAADTPAGTYSYTFELRGKEELLKTYTVRVHVWDFAIPEENDCATAVGIHRESLKRLHGLGDGEALDTLYKAYYDLLLDYRISAYDLPYDILDERADAYMSNPRVSSFCVPLYEGDDAKLTAVYEKLCSNPVWKEKAYFYPVDEPTDMKLLRKLEKDCERLDRLAPGIHVCTPFFRNIDVDADTDQISFMTGKTTIWCSKPEMYEDPNIFTPAQREKYPPFADRMAERKAAGDRVWWYVCWGPGNPYNNMFVDQMGIQHRILFWQQYAHNVDGFLYWNAAYWMITPDPWSDMATVRDLSPDIYGDGSLVYNGNFLDIEGGCASLRLAAIRDGVEDFSLFRMAEKLLGREWLDAEIEKITTSTIDYTLDSGLFVNVRREIGDAVEKAFKES